MPQDSVFRFVSLRAPVAHDDAGARAAITPEDGDTEPFEEAVERTSGNLLAERISRAASDFVKGGSFFTRRLGDQSAGWFREVERLVAEPSADAATFLQRAESLLDRARTPNDNLTSAWQTPALRRQVWSSYLASLIVGEESARDTRGLLAVLRLSYGHQRAAEGDYDPGSLNLASRRAAVPAHYLVLRLRAPGSTATAGADSAAPAEAPSRAPGSVQVAAAAARDLLMARSVLLAAAAKRQKRLMAESRKRLREQVERPISTARETSAAHLAQLEPNEDEPISITMTSQEPPEQLHELTVDEIDQATMATLERHGLDPTRHVLALTQQIDALIAAKFVESTRTGGSQIVAWQGSAFVRVNKPAPLGIGPLGTDEGAP